MIVEILQGGEQILGRDVFSQAASCAGFVCSLDQVLIGIVQQQHDRYLWPALADDAGSQHSIYPAQVDIQQGHIWLLHLAQLQDIIAVFGFADQLQLFQ